MDEEKGEDMIEVAPVIIWTMPVMAVRLAVSYMKIKRRSRRAVKSFRKSLSDEGLPPEVAKSLVSEYDESTSIFRRLVSSALHGSMSAK